MPYALYDVIFKSGDPGFCTRELKCNRVFFSQRRGILMWESYFLQTEGPASVAGFLFLDYYGSFSIRSEDNIEG